MTLPFSVVKRILQNTDPEAQWSPDAVLAAIAAAEARIREFGEQASRIAKAQGRVRVQREHLDVVVPTTTSLAPPVSVDGNSHDAPGWRVQQALARANMRLTKLGQRPELLGTPTPKEAKAQ